MTAQAALYVLATVYDCDPSAIATAVEMLLGHKHLTVQDSEAVAVAAATFPREARIEAAVRVALGSVK
jgi:hypothetical protein